MKISEGCVNYTAGSKQRIPFCFTIPEKFSIIEKNNLKSNGEIYEAE